MDNILGLHIHFPNVTLQPNESILRAAARAVSSHTSLLLTSVQVYIAPEVIGPSMDMHHLVLINRQECSQQATAPPAALSNISLSLPEIVMIAHHPNPAQLDRHFQQLPAANMTSKAKVMSAKSPPSPTTPSSSPKGKTTGSARNSLTRKNLHAFSISPLLDPPKVSKKTKSKTTSK